ncbi:hypothetical protein SFOMI_4412 [Sphingobium fuliginis]|uniref:Uncharacterized protein n=1 Tax=Sphingobium fuliginis (strain ATCC 27551) TaxID=336203 RepID=A0A292ZLJ5_SPHSA|nr:hypothetical protein SFOMI_4412 [Sphingobium fuliginis]
MFGTPFACQFPVHRQPSASEPRVFLTSDGVDHKAIMINGLEAAWVCGPSTHP